MLFSTNAVAQIVPDDTLGDESSSVNSSPTNGQQGEIIGGGAARGSNLFHSFESFSIPAGQRADFLNPSGITRIISRVTGDLPSDIQGTLGVLGNSDLYLINSNGISFGPNARLELGGSFVASTAASVEFADDTEFSTTPGAVPLLTTSVPVGLGFLEPSGISVRNEGREVVNDVFFDELSPRTGLAVSPSQTLALIGGDVTLEGGIIRSFGGRIELGSVNEGTVSISQENSGLSFSYQETDSLGRLSLSQLSLVDAGGIAPSEVRLVGRNINLQDGSLVFVRSASEGEPGSLEAIASQSIQIGLSSRPEPLVSALISQNLGAGRGPDVLVEAPQLMIQNGGQIVANTYSSAPSGNLSINAFEMLQVDGFSSVSEDIPSSVTTGALGEGRSGLFSVNAGDVRVSNGAQIGAIAGAGTPGSVEITARNITVDGSLPTLLKPSFLGIATAGRGDSGQLSIDTDTLRVLEGGAVGTTSVGSGDAGDTIIRANDSIEVSGSFPGALNTSSIDSSVTLINPITQILLRLAPTTPLVGDAGSISISTPELAVNDGGAIRVQNDGSGDAGDLSIIADNFQLDSTGRISAATSGGQGGSIDVDADSLVLSDQSFISASAAGTGQGGNIEIDSTLLGLLSNSSISANADQGFGGRVTVATDTLLQSPESIITATSAAGPELSGFVDIQVPNEEPVGTDAEAETPAVEDAELASSCGGGSGQSSEFRIAGDGGLPIAPNSLQQSYSGWLSQQPVSEAREIPERGSTIVEAQGWISDAGGTISLVAPNTAHTYAAGQNTVCTGSALSVR